MTYIAKLHVILGGCRDPMHNCQKMGRNALKKMKVRYQDGDPEQMVEKVWRRRDDEGRGKRLLDENATIQGGVGGF